jgi:flagellar basal body-associated protein FliL
VDLSEFVVNARSENSRLLLTTEVTLAVTPRGAKGEIERDEVIDSIVDAVNYELSYATPEELNNRDGRDVLKQLLMERVNELIYGGQVVDVFFGKFILQAFRRYCHHRHRRLHLHS